jgi:hypothetical protein
MYYKKVCTVLWKIIMIFVGSWQRWLASPRSMFQKLLAPILVEFFFCKSVTIERKNINVIQL